MQLNKCFLHGRSLDNRINMNAWIPNSIIYLFCRMKLIAMNTTRNQVWPFKTVVVDSDNLARDNATGTYAAIIFFWGLSVPISMLNVFVSLKRENRPLPGIKEAIRPAAAITMAFFLSYVWVQFSPSDILESAPRLFLFCIGTLVGHITVSCFRQLIFLVFLFTTFRLQTQTLHLNSQ